MAVGGTGGVAGLYGAFQSWLTKRKTRQLMIELLMTKLDIDLSYEIINKKEDDFKVLKGVVTFKNLGQTNLRITELDIEVEDRAKKFAEVYKGNFDPATDFEIKRFTGVSNSHLVTFGLMENQRGLFMKQTDAIFTQREGRTRILSVKDNISKYIAATLQRMKETLSEKNSDAFQRYYFKETLGSDLRGFQVFPGGHKTQKFLIDYRGSGVLYMNAEVTTIRVLQSPIDAHEHLKDWGVQVLNTGSLEVSQEEKFKTLASSILKPASDDFQREKETF